MREREIERERDRERQTKGSSYIWWGFASGLEETNKNTKALATALPTNRQTSEADHFMTSQVN